MNRAFKLFPATILLLALFSAGIASAQLSDISPYSRYGIGDLQDQSSVINFSMGGTGIAYHNDSISPFFVNMKNPASYAYGFIPYEDTSGKGGIKMATFEAGLVDNIFTLNTQGQTAKSNNAYLAYVVMNIPVSRRFGLAMGLAPVSTEGYNISSTNAIDSDGVPSKSTTVQNQYQGVGGINKVYIGAAFSPIKGLAIGANLAYMFGNLTNEEDIYFPLSPGGFNTLKLENVGIYSFYYDFGAMYTHNLSGNWIATIGATYAPPVGLNAGYSSFTGSEYVNGSSVTNMDTLTNTSYNGKVVMPTIIGLGLTIKKGDQWTFSLDYKMEKWSQYTAFGQSGGLSDTRTYGFGVQYVPKKFAGTYFQRIHYRLGASYGQNYLDLNNTPLIDECITAGVGLPIGPSNPFRNPAVLNIGLQVGTLGTTSNNLIQQNYTKLMFAFTFDDRWFDKRKFQ